MLPERDRTIHLQPGPFPAQAVSHDVNRPVVGVVVNVPPLSDYAALLSVFQDVEGSVAVVPLAGLGYPGRGLTPFMPAVALGSPLWMVKEQAICHVRSRWVPPAPNHIAGVIYLQTPRGWHHWYCDAYGHGFDNKPLLAPVLLVTPAT